MSFKDREKIFYIMAGIASLAGILFFIFGKIFLMGIAVFFSFIVTIWEVFGWRCPHCNHRLNRRDRELKKCPYCYKEYNAEE